MVTVALTAYPARHVLVDLGVEKDASSYVRSVDDVWRYSAHPADYLSPPAASAPFHWLARVGIDVGLLSRELALRGVGPITFVKDFGSTAALMLTVASPRVSDVEIEIVWDPPWNKSHLSERGRDLLRSWGVAA